MIVTDCERLVWFAVYAEYLRSPAPSLEPGKASRERIVLADAARACDAVAELRVLARSGSHGESAAVREVLR